MATLILKSKHSLPAKFRNEDGFEWEIEGVNNPSDKAAAVGAWGVPIPGPIFTEEQRKAAEANDVRNERHTAYLSFQEQLAKEMAEQKTGYHPPATETPLARIMRINFKAMNEIMNSKGKEYDGNIGDRLGNFRRNAAAMQVSMETVLMIYAEKHWGSIQSYVRSGNKVHSNESIEGRVRDLMNYMFLFLLMCEERSSENGTVANAAQQGPKS